MQKRTFLFLMVVGLLICGYTSAQVKIGDNPQTIDPASVLELESSERVLVITRVDSLQMAAITPSRGALVYNTSADCIFYFDGTAWNNLCEGGGGGAGGVVGFTTDPIANALSTIVITPTESGSNIEIAPNSINSEQIINGGINGIDIQNTSIGRGKLQDNSVDKSALAENSVGPFAIDNDSVDLADFNNVTGFIRGGEVISEDEGNAIVGGDDGRVFYDDSAVAANTASIAADNDQDATNEIQNLVFDSDTRTISLSESTSTVTLPAGADELDGDPENELITDSEVNGTTLTITEGDTTFDISLTDLEGLGDDGGTGSTEFADGTTILGTGSDIDKFRIAPGEDNQILTMDGTDVIWDDPPTVGEGGNQDLGEVLTEGNNAGATGITNLTTDGEDDTAAATVGFVNAAVTAGGGLTDGNILVGDASGSAVQVEVSGDATMDNKGILTIDDGAITLTKLNQMGADDGEILQWDGDAGEWTTAGVSAEAEFDDAGTDDGLKVQEDANGYDVAVDDSTIEIAGDALQIKNGGVTLEKLNQMGAEDQQILQWDGDAGEWTTAGVSAEAEFDDAGTDDGLKVQEDANGYDVAVDDSTIEIAGDALQIKNGGVTLEKLNQMGAEDQQILQWDGDSGEWTTAGVSAEAEFDDAGTDDGLKVQEDANGYDVAVDDSTIEIAGDALQIKNGGVTLEKLNQMGAEDQQILQWDGDSGEWTTAGVSAEAEFDDAGTDDGLKVQEDANGYDVAVDDLTIEIAGDALQIKNGGVTLEKLNQMGAEDQQILQWDGDAGEWTTAGVTTEAEFDDTGTNDGLTVQEDANGYDVVVDESTIEIAGDALQIKNAGVTNNKLNKLNIPISGFGLATADVALGGFKITGLATPVLDQDAATKEYVDNSAGSPTGTTGSIFFAGDDGEGIGGPTENNAQLFWDTTYGTNGGLGIGNNSPQRKLDVSGEVQSQGYANSNGSVAEPSYAFTNDPDTGMWRGENTNFLNFSTNKIAAISIDPGQNIGIGPEFYSNSSGNDILARLHVDGDVRAEGAFFSTTDAIQPIPDYVFQKYFSGSSELKSDYDFKTLEEIESFVKKHYHLPGIKSTAEVKRDGFWNLSESNIQNLEKIEELFLHTIEQEKKIKELQSEKEALSEELQSLRKDLDEIKAMLKKSK